MPDFSAGALSPLPEFDRGLAALEALGQRVKGAVSNPLATLQKIAESIRAEDKSFQGTYDKAFGSPMKPPPLDPAAIGELADKGMMLNGFAPAGIFAGLASKGFDPLTLRKATHMATRKADPAEIWGETGWGKAPDGNWKYEIDDSPMRMQLVGGMRDAHYGPGGGIRPVGEGVQVGAGGPFDNFSQSVEHPELFASYPSLDKIKGLLRVEPWRKPEDATGWLSRNPKGPADELGARAGTPEELANVVVHEIQHAVQKRQRWAGGGNPNQFMNQNFDAIPPGPQKDAMVARAFNLYQRIPGEAEARLAQSRAHLTEGERRDPANFPFGPMQFKAATGVGIDELLPLDWQFSKFNAR